MTGKRPNYIVQVLLILFGLALLAAPMAFVLPRGDAVKSAARNAGGANESGEQADESTDGSINESADERANEPELPAHGSMTLDGHPYSFKLGAPEASVTGDGDATLLTILFPSRWPIDSDQPGLQITLYSGVNSEGIEVECSANSEENPIRVSFFPDPVERWRESGNLAFSNWLLSDGRGQIRFDHLDAVPGGRVRGVLSEVTLHGVYTDPAFSYLVAPSETMTLLLRDFAFDVVVRGGEGPNASTEETTTTDEDNSEYEVVEDTAAPLPPDDEPESEGVNDATTRGWDPPDPE